MSDYSSDDDSHSDWVLYKDRPEWSDLKPIPQDKGPNPIICVNYSQRYEDVFDYFRALIHKNEISERAYELTKDAISMNPANYTVWHYRRQLLRALKKDLQNELMYVSEIIKENAKNYQVWYHRQVIVGWLKDGSLEKPFTEQVLKEDAKNYHAWQHRQWAIKEFSLWEGELDYVAKLIEEDIRNNSAWNQRYFIIKHTTGFSDPEIMKREIEFTQNAIQKVKQNESPWNYLRGIIGDGISKHPDVVGFCRGLYDSGCTSPHLLALLVDILEEQMTYDLVARPALLQEAVQILDSLAQTHDRIRKNYYNFLNKNLQMKYGCQGATGDAVA